MSEYTKEDASALAARIDGLPAYSGRDIGVKFYKLGMPESTAEGDTAVIFIEEKWRGMLAAALRALA